MGGWGIAKTASPKEKLKAEFADYIHGLNSVGEIDYGTYSELFDFGMALLDKMYDLGKSEVKARALTKLEEFQSLKAGDTILVKWGECGRGMKPIMVYQIPKVQHSQNEIICNIKQNQYFNYKMHLGLDTLGVNTSNARCVMLIDSEV